MFENKIEKTILFGYIEKDNSSQKNLVCSLELFGKKSLSSTTIKSIKLWFGSPPFKKDIKSLLGIQVKYINYITGEKKETDYQGASIDGVDDVEVKEIELKGGEYLSQFNILFKEYITYIKIGSKKNFKELGVFENEKQLSQLEEINSGNNVILNIKGLKSKNGIRCLGIDYIPYEYFFLIRSQDLFRLRLKLKNDKKFKQKFSNKNEYNKLSDEMKLILNVCLLARTPFATLIKYL